MLIFKQRAFHFIFAVLFAAFAASCGQTETTSETGIATSLGELPAVRLNYRYEADVPPPTETAPASTDERIAAVQADFDQNRPQELLDATIISPDRKRVLAVYHQPLDLPAEFRMDMYTVEGQLLRKITPDNMAVHFRETIRWAPDSSAAAFTAMARSALPTSAPSPVSPDSGSGALVPDANTATPTPPAEANVDNNADANMETPSPAAAPVAPTGILTFRTEQLYITDSEGVETKPVTQNEGLIYFYYVWSPDSTMLAALAATTREWQLLNDRADLAGEIFIPVGRPRLVEKNGRERRLDDALTAVQPVWSPDSSKVACGFDTQVRIYDAKGVTPTQAAVPLRNQLLLSSQAFDQAQAGSLNAAEPLPAADANAQNTNAVNVPRSSATLPDPATLVSFNPIVVLSWPSDDLLYFQTAFIKRMKNEADSVTSFPRWHRLVLSPQPMAPAK